MHDAWNRLVKVERWPSAGSPFAILENEFNGLNWRIRRRMDLSQGAYDGVDEERLYFFTPSWQMVEEWVDDDLDTTEDYRAQQFWGVRYIDDAVAKRLDRDNDGAWTTDAEDNWYYLTDVMFSVRGITDNDGQIHTRVDYTPYGVAMHRYAADINGDGLINNTDITTFNSNAGSGLEPGDIGYDPDTDLNGDGFAEDYLTAEWPLYYDTRYTPYSTGGSNPTVNAGWIDNPADPNGPDNSIGYDGYWFDLAGAADAASAGLYMVRYRVYDPGMGRWLERDPAGTIDGSSLYAYSRSNTANLSDPSGLSSGGPLTRGESLKTYTDCSEWKLVRDEYRVPRRFSARRDKTRFATVTVVGRGRTGDLRNGVRDEQMEDGSILIPNPFTIIPEKGTYADGTLISNIIGSCYKEIDFVECCEADCCVEPSAWGTLGDYHTPATRQTVTVCNTAVVRVQGTLRKTYFDGPGSGPLNVREHRWQTWCDISQSSIDAAKKAANFKGCEAMPKSYKVRKIDH